MEGAVSPETGLFRSPERESFRNNALLIGIPERVCSQIARKITTVRCDPREIIFDEDDPGDSLYLIAQGSVKISKRGRGGKQEVLTHLLEHDFFGEMALVDRGRRSAQAAAVGHTVLGRVDRETWDLLLHLAPHEVLGNFTRTVTKRLRQNNQHFIEQMMHTERLSLLGTTVSSIVHDMNNPIGRILIACATLQEKIQDELTREMTTMIREAVGQMDMMTRELVDFSRGKTELHLETVSIAELLASLQPDLVDCGPHTTVRVETQFNGNLRVDKQRLLRVFGNLIRNARESMESGTQRELRLSVQQVDANVRFEISDTGCGIPKDLLPTIFEPFATYRKAKGRGLGLAISKAVVEAHGGTISAFSSGKGASFQIDLPLPG